MPGFEPGSKAREAFMMGHTLHERQPTDLSPVFIRIQKDNSSPSENCEKVKQLAVSFGTTFTFTFVPSSSLDILGLDSIGYEHKTTLL